MKIAIIGYGKMGREIEQVSVGRGHEVVLRADVGSNGELFYDSLSKADVALEFTSPASAVSNYLECFKSGVPVVSGTTGWLEEWGKVTDACKKSEGCFFYASNFSLGVNLFFELNKKLALMMKSFEQYKVSVAETHHTQKLDAPSGTAISLADDIIDTSERKSGWTINEVALDSELHIASTREENVPGIHSVKYDSDIDFIEIMHSAKNRKGFALGAVMAAEFCKGRRGIFSMSDMIKL